MRNNSTVFIFGIVLGFTINSFAQSERPVPYIIFTIEDTYKVSQHGTQTYFWIIPVDSIKSHNMTISRLFLSDFTRSNLEDCCLGKPFDPFVYDQDPSIALDSDYRERLDNLKQLVRQRKKKIQKIDKKWESGQAETVVIFATPVVGEFCSSDFHPIGQHRTGYRGRVYLPKASFRYDDTFWSSSRADYVMKKDFSLLDFDIISN